MLSRLTAQGRGVPNLVVAKRVVDKMVSAAQRFVQDETGEAMIGLLVPGTRTNGVPTLYVLDTISPDESAVREAFTFHQGDEHQDELIWWLQENWRVHREQHEGAANAKWNVPLRYLGDWHKQPGFMIQPSGGDLMTALNWIDDPDNDMDFLLAPILTLDHAPTTVQGEAAVNFLTAPQGDGLNARIDFWYIDSKVRMFLPVIPAVYPDDQLPTLSEYPWHLVNEDRFATESAQLTGDKLFATVILWNVVPKPPLEICFLTARVGSEKVILVITSWDYPKSPPSARIAPFVAMGQDDDVYKIFEQLWKQSEPVPDPPGWTWSPDKYLVDYIHAIEATLGSAAPSAPPDGGTKASKQEVADELG
jgi:hypothetical protein